mgnify:CR=1 FL=1
MFLYLCSMKKDIVGFPSYYALSTGQIFSKNRLKYCGHNGSKPHILKEKQLKGRKVKSGYLSVILYGTIIKSFRIHRLIWEAFKEKIPIGKEINHKNGIKTDNYIENLECITHTENMRHAEISGMVNHPKGENNTQSKLLNDEVLKIRMLYKSGYNISKLAKDHFVSGTTISRIIHRETWKHL